MLKDITMGQYFPGNSPIHRLDPRTKILFLVAYIVALFSASNWVSYGAVFLSDINLKNLLIVNNLLF